MAAFAGSLSHQIAVSPRAGAAMTRVASIDSLRGLAALSVVACHYLILLADTPFGQQVSPWLRLPPFSLFKTAYGAVILFFVLSGYVLALSLLGDGMRPSWVGFAVRRFFRIWPPFALTILVSFAIGFATLATEPGFPAIWRTNLWHRDDIIVATLFNQISMVASHISLDVPGWSLVHELRITLAFPLLLCLVRRAPAATFGLALFLHLANGHGPPWLAGLIPDTASFIVFFVAGALLALHGTKVAVLARASLVTKLGLLAVALTLLSVPGSHPWSGGVAGVGAVLIVAVVTASPEFEDVLSVPWCTSLGRVSYSLYLTHVVVLMTLGRALGEVLPVWLILLLALPVICLVAWSGHRWVEQPSIRVGRAIAARFAAGSRVCTR